MLGDYFARCGEQRSKAERRSPSTTCEKNWAWARQVDRDAVFHVEFREDLRHWVKVDRNTALRAL
jgi:hypothetical protein